MRYAREVVSRRLDISCEKCVSLREAHDIATRKYIDLIKEQEHLAAVTPELAWPLDSLIEIAVSRRDAARSALEIHTVLEHKKRATRRMSASGNSHSE
jgi:hypothetical protein